MLRRTALALVAALPLAGCGGGPPEVVFTAEGTSVPARPAQYCDLQLTECNDDPTAPVVLAVPPGTPLRVEVSGEIAEAPWHVAFSYINAAGAQVDARSALFRPDERTEYVLELPAPGDRLRTAQVQQFGPAPQTDAATGEVQFPVRGTWVLTTS